MTAPKTEKDGVDMNAGTVCGIPYNEDVHIHADARCWPDPRTEAPSDFVVVHRARGLWRWGVRDLRQPDVLANECFTRKGAERWIARHTWRHSEQGKRPGKAQS